MIKKIIQSWLGKKFRSAGGKPASSGHAAHDQQPSKQNPQAKKPANKRQPAKTSNTSNINARHYTHQQHQIDSRYISDAAKRTIQGLQKAGFTAYIVGGAVRDLLLNIAPKDFDVATDATPEQVRQLFKRSRIIGRRFRLVHVMFGNETIEVSTFRGEGEAEDDDNRQTTESGRIIRDNVFGSIEQDATRRDFTVNALYYDPQQQVLVDFHDGFQDVRQGVLRIIGDAEQRYREDPVRMLRAVRLSAKLGLRLEPHTAAPISQMADCLAEVPPSRLFDEMLKLFLSGHALQSVQTLRNFHLHHGLLPLLDVVLEQPLGERFVHLALANTDQRVLSGKPVSPAFLFATLLWHEVLAAWQKYQSQMPLMPAIHQAMDDVIRIQTDKLAIHKRFTAGMREIWAMQARFEYRHGRRPYSLLEHPRFRAAYDFFLLRCESGEVSAELAHWWQQFVEADSSTRANLLLPEQGKKKRRRRKRKSSSGEHQAGENNTAQSHTDQHSEP